MAADIVHPAEHVDAMVSVLNDVCARQLGIMLGAQDADALLTGLSNQGYVLIEDRDLEAVLTSTEQPKPASPAHTRQIHVHCHLPKNMSQKDLQNLFDKLNNPDADLPSSA